MRNKQFPKWFLQIIVTVAPQTSCDGWIRHEKNFLLYSQEQGFRNCLQTHPPIPTAGAINHHFVHTEQKAGITGRCRESCPSCGQQGTRLGHMTPNLIFIFPSSSVTFVLFHSIRCRTICHFQVTPLYSTSHWQARPHSTRYFNSF